MQGDPISGYLFFLVMEILALMIAKENLKPYKTANGHDHILDIFVDDLTIYLKYDKRNYLKNREKVQKILQIMRKFQEWSGLKINLGKIYLAILGKLKKNSR